MRIGIVGQETENHFGINHEYYALAEQYGRPVIISPIRADEFFQTYGIDGLILPGGADINPLRYNNMPRIEINRPNPFLEYFDVHILPVIIEKRIPIFGICRGLQTLNVHFGGTLYQDISGHPYSSNAVHLVHEISGTDLNNRSFKQKVNSFHHQAIDKMGAGLSTMAVSDDGYVEAICHRTLPIYAVQWHPERCYDAFGLSLMNKLFKK